MSTEGHKFSSCLVSLTTPGSSQVDHGHGELTQPQNGFRIQESFHFTHSKF